MFEASISPLTVAFASVIRLYFGLDPALASVAVAPRTVARPPFALRSLDSKQSVNARITSCSDDSILNVKMQHHFTLPFAVKAEQ